MIKSLLKFLLNSLKSLIVFLICCILFIIMMSPVVLCGVIVFKTIEGVGSVATSVIIEPLDEFSKDLKKVSKALDESIVEINKAKSDLNK